LALLPVVFTEILQRTRFQSPLVGTLSGLVSLLLIILIASPTVVQPSFDSIRHALHLGGPIRVHTVSRKGRSFPLADPRSAGAAQDAVSFVDRITKPGDKLFVGPGDLRRTNYTDTFFYFLFPDLTPSTYYLQMEPGTANAEHSRLAADVQNADVAILNTLYDAWSERNSSMRFGSDAANEVIRRDFCVSGSFGTYRVLVRCGPHAA
jgi:hypothetical protein